MNFCRNKNIYRYRRTLYTLCKNFIISFKACFVNNSNFISLTFEPHFKPDSVGFCGHCVSITVLRKHLRCRHLFKHRFKHAAVFKYNLFNFPEYMNNTRRLNSPSLNRSLYGISNFSPSFGF